MADNLISYVEMCQREGASLQRGMNYRLGPSHSVILMSVRPSAPCRDRWEDSGTALIYEGHDHPRTEQCTDPKAVDQPLASPHGTPTQNGRFLDAAQAAKCGERAPEPVEVYEKIRSGIWSYNGLFHLVDAWQESDGTRTVCMFKLIAVDDTKVDSTSREGVDPHRRRVIPTSVKLEVWKRDGGKCAMCGATDELHFDHIVPFSKGGTSLNAENVQLLCARHNLAKHDRIE